MDPTPEQLAKIYDQAFEKQASKKSSRPGDAHKVALKAVYEKGKVDGAKRRTEGY
jgi:hypothetical protein